MVLKNASNKNITEQRFYFSLFYMPKEGEIIYLVLLFLLNLVFILTFSGNYIFIQHSIFHNVIIVLSHRKQILNFKNMNGLYFQSFTWGKFRPTSTDKIKYLWCFAYVSIFWWSQLISIKKSYVQTLNYL